MPNTLASLNRSARRRTRKRNRQLKALTTSKRVTNVEKRISKIRNDEELKYVQRSTINFPLDDFVDSSGDLYLLNGTSIGATVNNRIGSVARFTSTHIRGHLHPQATATASPTEVRLIVFWDRQPNVAAPTIFRSTGTTGILDDTFATNGVVHSPYNFETVQRYRILWDKTYILYNNGTTLQTASAIVIDKKIKLGRKTKYIDTSPGSGTISDIQTNALWLLTLGNLTAASGDGPDISFNTQTYFKDT